VHHCALSSQAGRIRLLVALTLALVALVTLPAAAFAGTTSLTLVASPATTSYGGTAILTGTLMDTSGVPVALGSMPVCVWASQSGVFPGTLLAVVTTGQGTPAYETGTYTLAVAPAGRTYYQMTFAATGAFAAASSNIVRVTPRVYLSKPRVPRAAHRGQRFRLVSVLQPRHTAGARNSVAFKVYRYSAKRWVIKKTVWAKNANYLNMTTCSATATLTRTGLWRVRAVAPADGKHARTRSAWSKVFRVN
jgi:hypothetical protein